ncbi:MAG: hypothetical protein OXK79_12605 [Chloroflexota bacterium]|nr:hypothetical protein [Chloroflexota bacterium]
MTLSDRRLLDVLRGMPVVESMELVLSLDEPRRNDHRRLAERPDHVIVERISHGASTCHRAGDTA